MQDQTNLASIVLFSLKGSFYLHLCVQVWACALVVCMFVCVFALVILCGLVPVCVGLPIRAQQVGIQQDQGLAEENFERENSSLKCCSLIKQTLSDNLWWTGTL